MVADTSAPPRTPRRRGRRGSSGVPAGRGVLARLTPYLFLLAAVGLLLLLTYLPAANMLWYSLTDWDGLDLDKQFVGIDNYVQ
ncbi:MAG: sugar ABC transporter permease, partial [Protaetiibacter sp.]